MLERTGVGGLRRFLMAAQGELVLLTPADLVFAGQVLGGQAHLLGGDAVAELETRAEVKAGLHRDVLHVLDAARDLHIVHAGHDALGRLVDRLEAGAAQAIDGGRRHFDREAGG